MELNDAMSTLRAVRRLKPDPIPADVLERVLQAGCWAPTGGNQQPWRVIVVQDPERKQAVADIYRPEWDAYKVESLKRFEAADPEPEALAAHVRTLAAGTYLAEHFGEAPALLVFCANPKMMAITDARLDRISMVGGGSVYPAVQNVMLACVQEGLGCVLTTLHCQVESKVHEALEIPTSWATVAIVPIGYPVNKGHGPISRRPPAKMAYRDTFGTAWE